MALQDATTVIDLVKVGHNLSEHDKFERVLNTFHTRGRIVVVAGAGISTKAGIPDFRSPTGLFSTQKGAGGPGGGHDLFESTVYRTAAKLDAFHEMIERLLTKCTRARPTMFHRVLDDLAAEGRLMRLYTQNIDGLDVQLPSLTTTIPLQRVGSIWPKAVQLHGSIHTAVCIHCWNICNSKDAAFVGDKLPRCKSCSDSTNSRSSCRSLRERTDGGLRPRISLYGESSFDEDSIADVVNTDTRARPEVLVVVGTSLKVEGTKNVVKQLSAAVREHPRGLTIWINNDVTQPPKLPTGWDIVVQGQIEDLSSRLCMGCSPLG